MVVFMKGRINLSDVVIVDAIRTATGKRKGAFSDTHPVDILTPVLKALVERSDLDPALVEDVVTGCVSMTDEQGGNIGRLAVLAAGFPVEVPAFSLNRMCVSSQQASDSESHAISVGDAHPTPPRAVQGQPRVSAGRPMGGASNQPSNRQKPAGQGYRSAIRATRPPVRRAVL